MLAQELHDLGLSLHTLDEQSIRSLTLASPIVVIKSYLIDDCFYYHSWRNNAVIVFGTLLSFLT